MATAKQTIIFSDLDLSFLASPINGDIVKITNVNAINRSIQNIVLSNMFDHPMRPDIASPIGSLLFQTFTTDIANVLEKVITSLLTNFEPRVNVIGVNVSSSPETHSIGATITYTIVNNPTPISFNIILKRLR